VIDAHSLESQDPAERLRFGVALLQTIEPNTDVGKQQEKAALAFVQAQKEGARAQEVEAALGQSVFLSLREALALLDIAIPERIWTGTGAKLKEASGEERAAVQAYCAQQPTPPSDLLREITAALARVFALELPQQAGLLDQLLAAKGQLRNKEASAADVEEALLREHPDHGQAWLDALQKVLLVLR
jgi:hypothetical protein